MPEAVTYVLAYAASSAGITFGVESSLILLSAGYVTVGAVVPAVGGSLARVVVRRHAHS